MAIEPKIRIEYEADASKITVTDKTGVYDVNNEIGYGDPNDERSEIALALLAYYQPYDEDKELIIEESDIVRFDANYLNGEESQWVVPYGKDGWYQIIMVVVPTSITPLEGRVIYSVSDSGLRQYDADLNLIEVYDLSELDNEAIYPLIKKNEFPLAKNKTLKNKKAKDFFLDSCAADCEYGQEFKEILQYGQEIQTSINYFNIAPYEAQKTVEILNKKYKLV